MRSLTHPLPTLTASLATPQSAAVTAGCDSVYPNNTQIFTDIKAENSAAI
ncbi:MULTISPECIES: hypothetical protein [Cyanophyceae]|nr:hypothetical protein [Trichocoleus sp. FACHB-69]MBD1933326.1 hypothetical protein [Trichocoleus sp. FACHB-69]